ncbi:paired small multidrug resistance pump [Bacillus sp. SORGH_AS 510]|nr:paired small multidrug resistance pump [Bacillus sp. SORGH_AS_0510]
MNTNWFKVFIAAFFEVFWVTGLKHAEGFWTWTGTVLSIIISFLGIIMAARKLPVGTVYAVFVGLGTAGTVITEMIFFGEPFKMTKILLYFTVTCRCHRFEISYKGKCSGRG